MEVEFNSSVGPGFSTSDSDLAIRFAGGFDVYLTEHVVAYGGVDYVLPTGDVKDLDYLSFGAGVFFASRRIVVGLAGPVFDRHEKRRLLRYLRTHAPVAQLDRAAAF